MNAYGISLSLSHSRTHTHTHTHNWYCVGYNFVVGFIPKYRRCDNTDKHLPTWTKQTHPAHYRLPIDLSTYVHDYRLAVMYTRKLPT